MEITEELFPRGRRVIRVASQNLQEVWVCEIGAPTCTRITDEGFPIGWTTDDKAVVVRDPASNRLHVVELATGRVTDGMTLSDSSADMQRFTKVITLEADGKAMWVIESDDERDIWMLEYEGNQTSAVGSARL